MITSAASRALLRRSTPSNRPGSVRPVCSDRFDVSTGRPVAAATASAYLSTKPGHPGQSSGRLYGIESPTATSRRLSSAGAVDSAAWLTTPAPRPRRNTRRRAPTPRRPRGQFPGAGAAAATGSWIGSAGWRSTSRARSPLAGNMGTSWSESAAPTLRKAAARWRPCGLRGRSAAHDGCPQSFRRSALPASGGEPHQCRWQPAGGCWRWLPVSPSISLRSGRTMWPVGCPTLPSDGRSWAARCCCPGASPAIGWCCSSG